MTQTNGTEVTNHEIITANNKSVAMHSILPVEHQQTSWKRVLPEKVTVAQLIKKFPEFKEAKSSLPFPQELATGPYPKPDKSNPQQHILFL
jgi:hypothetical protein